MTVRIIDGRGQIPYRNALKMATTVPCALETLETYSFKSVIRGHHAFKSISSPFVGETLAVKQEKGNRHDRFAVAVIRRQSRPAVTTIS